MKEEFIKVLKDEGITEAVEMIKEDIEDRETLEMLDCLTDQYIEMDTELFKCALILGDNKRKIEALEKTCNELQEELKAYKLEFM